MKRLSSAILTCCLFLVAPVLAQTPPILNYQGRLSIAGTNFNGVAQFKFAILNERGAMVWAMLPVPEVGALGPLPGSVNVAVQNGLYAVRLGDTGLGMPALDPASLREDAKLRVWFNDPSRGWQLTGADLPLSIGNAENSGAAITSGQADEILRELRAIRLLLERQQRGPAPSQPAPPPATATVPLGNAPSLGQANAPLVIVEFTDFQCSFCKKFHDTVFPELKKNYIDTGKLRWVARNLPLPFHNQAEPAAQAALCAHAQEKIWPMREWLFTNSAALSPETISKAAAGAGLDMGKFQSCLSAKTFAADVEADKTAAQFANITGTPTFVLGRAGSSNLVGRVIIGAQPLANFEAEIKQLLHAGGQPVPVPASPK